MVLFHGERHGVTIASYKESDAYRQPIKYFDETFGSVNLTLTKQIQNQKR